MNSTLNKSDYISLTDAAAHSPYTQEYLSLRARQGKLRAIKRGRNWVTTLGWLDDYLHQVDEAKSELREATIVDLPAAAADTDFAFRPAASVALPHKEKQAEPVGTIIAEEPVGVASTFSWEEEEEPVRLTYKQQRHFETLQRRMDQQFTADEPAIALAIDNESLASPVAIHHYRDAASTAPAHNPQAVDSLSDTETASFGHTLASIVRPVAATAAVILVISSLMIFDGTLKIRESIALGTGIVLSDIGNSLVRIGSEPKAVSPRLSTVQASRGSGFGMVSADAPSGRVAGVSTEAASNGFWATVWLGAQALLGN